MIRFSKAPKTRSPLSEQVGVAVFEIDQNRVSTGGFRTPRSRICDGPLEALRMAAAIQSPHGDLLIRPVGTGARRGWQVFERRTAQGRTVVPNGSCRKMKRVGDGTIYIA